MKRACTVRAEACSSGLPPYYASCVLLHVTTVAATIADIANHRCEASEWVGGLVEAPPGLRGAALRVCWPCDLHLLFAVLHFLS